MWGGGDWGGVIFVNPEAIAFFDTLTLVLLLIQIIPLCACIQNHITFFFKLGMYTNCLWWTSDLFMVFPASNLLTDRIDIIHLQAETSIQILLKQKQSICSFIHSLYILYPVMCEVPGRWWLFPTHTSYTLSRRSKGQAQTNNHGNRCSHLEHVTTYS